MSSDLHLLSFSVTCLFKKRKKGKNCTQLYTVYWRCMWIVFRRPLIFWLAPPSPIFIAFHRPTMHSKRDGYIWGMENRQGYYVWGLFSQNRVWHDVTVTRLKVFLAIPSTLPLPVFIRLTSTNSSSRVSFPFRKLYSLVLSHWDDYEGNSDLRKERKSNNIGLSGIQPIEIVNVTRQVSHTEIERV